MDNEILFAPWRADFVLGEKEEGCPLCNVLTAKKDSVENLVLHRAGQCFVLMNKFPYNSGHLMVCPKRHVAQFEELTSQESSELIELAQRSVLIMKRVLKPHSFNLGMNIGSGSGAGIPEHIHMHLVPRWHGDTNFMAVVGKTKVVSVPQDPVYESLLVEFKKL